MQHNANILTTREAADLLRAHVETVRRLARRGEIPAYKIGKDWRFRRDALLRWTETHRFRRRERHVLVVDDEEIVRDTFSRMLRVGGLEAATASTGGEALELMRRDTPDVVILDLKMPGMGGPATLKQIREDYEQMPVVIITGYPDSELMHEALKYSPLMVLAKPIGLHPLLAAMRLALGEGHEGAMHPKANGG